MSEKSAIHGKAFEFAVLNCLYEHFAANQNVTVQDSRARVSAERAFSLLDEIQKLDLQQAARTGVLMLEEREPQLFSDEPDSQLELLLQSDQKGQEGDVHDILIARNSPDWQIGISAKHNHKAVKSSRLAKQLDFGKVWLKCPCSDTYKQQVLAIFAELKPLVRHVAWRDLSAHGIDKGSVYQRVLNAFRQELLRMYGELGADIPTRLIHYLIGNYDFYKLMKIKDRTQLQAFNLNGTLGQKSKLRKPRPEPHVLHLPGKIHDIDYAEDSPKTTLIVVCDHGWQLSFRIHNASEFVEQSLKFDITLIGQPAELATQEKCWRTTMESVNRFVSKG